MARPGASVTGLTMSVGYQLAGKRVELLKDIKPKLSGLAVLSQPDNPTAGPYLQEVEAVSRALSIVVRGFDVRSVEELPRAFAAMVEWQADGVITHADALLFSQRARVVKLSLDRGLAAVHPEAEFPERVGCCPTARSARSVSSRRIYVDASLRVKSRPTCRCSSRPSTSWSSISRLRKALGLDDRP